VGQGALAAISAYRYLIDKGLLVQKGMEKDTWS